MFRYHVGTWKMLCGTAAILFLLSPRVLFGACNPGDVVWNGSSSSPDWNDPQNWTPNTTPTSSTNVCIDGSVKWTPLIFGSAGEVQNLTINSNNTIQVEAPFDIAGSTVNNSGTISGGPLGFENTVNLTGSGTVQLNGTFANEGVINIGTSLTNSGNTIQGSGYLIPLSSNSIFINAPNGTVNANDAGKTLYGTGFGGQDFGFGNFVNQGLMEATNGGTLMLGADPSVPFPTGGVINAGGTIQAIGAGSQVGIGGILQGGTLTTSSGGTIFASTSLILDASSRGQLNNAGNLVSSSDILIQGTINNAGSVVINSSATLSGISFFGPVNLSGNGSFTFSDNSQIETGTQLINSGNTITFVGGSGGNNNPINHSTVGSPMGYVQNSGTFDLQQGAKVHALISINGGTAQIDGILDESLAFPGPGVVASGAELEGTGEVIGNITSSGIVHPGDSPGVLTITNNYTQSSTGTLDIDIADISDFSQLLIGGSASLDGTLDLNLLGGYVPNVGDTFEIMKYSSFTGSFANIVGQQIGPNEYFDVAYDPTDITLTVKATQASAVPEPGTLALIVGGLLVMGLYYRRGCRLQIHAG